MKLVQPTGHRALDPVAQAVDQGPVLTLECLDGLGGSHEKKLVLDDLAALPRPVTEETEERAEQEPGDRAAGTACGLLPGIAGALAPSRKNQQAAQGEQAPEEECILAMRMPRLDLNRVDLVDRKAFASEPGEVPVHADRHISPDTHLPPHLGIWNYSPSS